MLDQHYLEVELQGRLRSDLDIFKFIEAHSLDGLWYWDLEQPENEYMNARFWEVLGYLPESKEHSPSAWQDIIDPEDLEIAKANMEKHLADPSYPYDQIVRYEHADGSNVWVRCRGIAIRNEEGTPIRFLGCHNDVTELKNSESQAKELLHSYQALVETRSIFFIKTDLLGNYTYANDCFLERFGYEFDALMGTPSLNTICEEDHPKTYEVVQKCFEQPNTPHAVILKKPYGDGRVRSNHWEFYGVTDEKGEPIEVVCVGVEITELLDRTAEIQRLLDQQADKNNRLQQHSYITSHNIRNSVANIKGIFEMIEAEPDAAVNYLSMLKTSVEALDETIENLTRILTEEKEAAYAVLEEVYIRASIQRLLDLEQSVVVQKSVEVVIDIDPRANIRTLPVYFDSVFHNLISNALKYGVGGEKPSKIRIIYHKDDETESIEVVDNGEGFDLPNNAELLFRMGTRLNRDTIGQGLGLFITRHHARMIGAEIEVQSQKGHGASFKVIWSG